MLLEIQSQIYQPLFCIGIDNVDLNLNEQKATITGKVNPMEVYAAVRKKCGKGTVLLYPERKARNYDQFHHQDS